MIETLEQKNKILEKFSKYLSYDGFDDFQKAELLRLKATFFLQNYKNEVQ
jgi:hypothetical protein